MTTTSPFRKPSSSTEQKADMTTTSGSGTEEEAARADLRAAVEEAIAALGPDAKARFPELAMSVQRLNALTRTGTAGECEAAMMQTMRLVEAAQVRLAQPMHSPVGLLGYGLLGVVGGALAMIIIVALIVIAVAAR